MKEDEAKYQSQRKLLIAIDKFFMKLIRNRDSLIQKKKHPKTFEKEIINLDLQIAQCIKKRARVTKGGYTNIPEKMWEWEPFYKLDSKLLPKTCH